MRDTTFDTTSGVDLVTLDPDSPVPPFEQVRLQIAAAHLGLAVNTVARSYRQLELAGLLETRGRHGTFVAPGLAGNRKRAVSEAKNFARRMRELGIGKAETLAMIRHEVERPDAPGPPVP